MALGTLEVIFIVMVLVSGIGIALLYLIKNQNIKDGLFYFLVIWGIVVAYMNVTRLPSNYQVEMIIALVFGLLALLGLNIKILKPEKRNVAYLLVTVSILTSMVHLFLF